MFNIDWVERGNCPLCGGRPVPYLDFSNVPVVKCEECGFIHSGRLMSPKTADEYYSDHYGGCRHQQGQRVNAEINILALEKMVNLKKIGRFLDVGTGYGFLLDKLKTHYPDMHVKGVELSRKEASYGRDVLNLDIVTTPLEESEYEKESFDLVATFEVIEHVADPVGFLKSLLKYVKRGGMVLVMTDNFQSDVVRSLGAEFPKWIPHAHISHFSPESLSKCINLSGGEIEKKLSFTPWEFIARCWAMNNRPPKHAAESFDLDESLKSESEGKFKYFGMRKWLNPLWFRFSAMENLDGELMYVLLRRVS